MSGIADARWGAVPAAAIVLHPGAAATDEELLRHCRARLAGYELPVRIVRLEALPRNELGKVVRRELHALLERERA